VPKRPGCAPFCSTGPERPGLGIVQSALDADQLALAACTRLIEANRLAGHDIAVAYWLRGKMDWRLREFGVAIADEERPVEIDPDFADAYAARSAAYGIGLTKIV
jgi:hypothetical protein